MKTSRLAIICLNKYGFLPVSGLLHPGDLLVEVNGNPVVGLEPEQVIHILVCYQHLLKIRKTLFKRKYYYQCYCIHFRNIKGSFYHLIQKPFKVKKKKKKKTKKKENENVKHKLYSINNMYK